MAISKARKDELVAQYIELINESNAIFVTDYTGLSVSDLEALREKVREVDGAFYVTKNRLLRVAMEQTNTPVPEELLIGQVAAGFAMSDAPPLAKTLVDYAKKEEKLIIKGVVFDGDVLAADGVKALASLPTLPEVQSQLVGIISAPARNLAAVIAGGVRQVINVVDAYAKSEEPAEAA